MNKIQIVCLILTIVVYSRWIYTFYHLMTNKRAYANLMVGNGKINTSTSDWLLFLGPLGIWYFA